ncbi:hypothetical protein IWZ03DRAFT_402634 [Phyllosticta citriasiana]|uniref:Uncharacterized protein n=1 Tax=Phyllosticta citriasiana TaxID=595635 RepID=A0ABR1KX80_9PEZI
MAIDQLVGLIASVLPVVSNTFKRCVGYEQFDNIDAIASGEGARDGCHISRTMVTVKQLSDMLTATNDQNLSPDHWLMMKWRMRSGHSLASTYVNFLIWTQLRDEGKEHHLTCRAESLTWRSQKLERPPFVGQCLTGAHAMLIFSFGATNLKRMKIVDELASGLKDDERAMWEQCVRLGGPGSGVTVERIERLPVNYGFETALMYDAIEMNMRIQKSLEEAMKDTEDDEVASTWSEILEEEVRQTALHRSQKRLKDQASSGMTTVEVPV